MSTTCQMAEDFIHGIPRQALTVVHFVRRPIHWLILLLLVEGFVVSAFGDGKVFSPPGYLRAETPSQRALVHWHDGVETLVVETTARSQATNLSWIVPLPARPTVVRAVDAGLFPTLQNLFQPRVIVAVTWGWAGGVVVCLVILVLRWAMQRKISMRFVDAVAVLGMLVILGSMLLPALGSAKGKGHLSGSDAYSNEGVSVLSEERAGVFEITTLTASNSSALVRWLESRGFEVPAGITSVAQDYLNRGWVFVAARVGHPRPGELAALHPVLFQFASREPVYPMRLTGVGTSSLDCDLYVFGAARAVARGWRVRYCGVPDFSERSLPAMGPYPLRIRHPELKALVSGATVATKLSARLTTASMAQDVVLRWQPIRAEGQTVYVWKAALTEALLYPAWILATVLAVGGLRWFRTVGPIPWFTSFDQGGAMVAAVVGLIGILVIPIVPSSKVERAIRRGASGDARSALKLLALDTAELPAVRAYFREAGVAARSNALHDAQKEVSEFLDRDEFPMSVGMLSTNLLNPFTGRRMRLESSPGNLSLVAADRRLDLVWHDFDGAPVYFLDVPSLEGIPMKPADTER